MTDRTPATGVDTSALNHAMSEVSCCSVANYRELALLDTRHADRPYVEAFVQEVFFKAYQTSLNTFDPLLLSISSPNDGHRGSYAAVAGVRPAGGEPLFLEHYLDQTIEKVLGVERHKIIEIGNLAPANAGRYRARS